MLTFLSPCHRCSVLRQLGCKDGKNWNSKYVISWYMWHKINNTLLSLPTTRCIRIHCFSRSRQSAFCLFSLKRHIFVSKLLIDSYLDEPWKWNICRILKRREVVTVWSFSFRWWSVSSRGTLESFNLFASLSRRKCEGTPDPAFVSTYAQKALMAPFFQVYQMKSLLFALSLPSHLCLLIFNVHTLMSER